jgi:thymidylate kinase
VTETNTNMSEYVATQESSTLLQELLGNKVRFAHWKSNGHLLKSLEGKTDLDLLVHPQDRHLYEESLTRLGYKKIISQAWSSYPLVEDWLGFDTVTGNLLHLHTHYAMVTGIQHVKHLYLPWVEQFFNHTTIDANTGWPIPEPALEAIILLVRIWAKMPPTERIKKQPTILGYLIDELVNLLSKTDPEQVTLLCEQLNLTVPADLPQKLHRIQIERRPKDILDVSIYFYEQLKPYYRSSWSVSILKSNMHKFRIKSSRVYSRLSGPFKFGKTLVNGGKVIAFVGSDGSGKSTLTRDILNWLTYKIDAHYFYFGKNPFIFSYNKQIISRTDLLFKQDKLSKLLKKLLGNTYYPILINRKVEMLEHAKRMSRTGSVVICDRFPQLDVKGMNDGPHLHADDWCANMEMKQFAKVRKNDADLVFRLLVSPEVACARKPEHNSDMIHVKCENIGKISFGSAKVIDIDADKPYEQVLLQVKREVWKYL